jgi:hypothetical protein
MAKEQRSVCAKKALTNELSCHRIVDNVIKNALWDAEV